MIVRRDDDVAARRIVPGVALNLALATVSVREIHLEPIAAQRVGAAAPDFDLPIAIAVHARLTERGPNYYAPTVLAGATPEMRLSSEETFGPVVPLFRFDDEDEVVRAANDTPFGLATYFYSQDLRRIDRVSRQLEAGLVGINEGALSSEAAPFGGVKESGYGREGSKYGLDDYLSTKYLCQGNLE